MTVALLGFLIMIVLMILGMPIAFSMLSVGFIGYGLVMNFQAALGAMSLTPYDAVGQYLLSVIPLFILMGEFAFHSGIVADIYYAAYKWVGHYRGGLCMATIGACAGFAATTGSSLAGSTIMTQVTWPEMKSRKYKPALGLGCIAAGGTLGILIPPSNPMIVFGILTDSSVGKLFMAGLLPAILLVSLFIATVIVVSRVSKDSAPAGPKASWKERIESLKKVWMMMMLMIVVLGGIWGGIFTSTEAAAIGSLGALIIALIRRTMTLKKFFLCIENTMKITGMIFVLIIGSSVFTTFIGATHAPAILADWVTTLAMPKIGVIIAMLVVYLILGCLMDTLSMILLTLPIFSPIVSGLGYDMIWFGILVVIMTEMGMITPPVGMNVFVVSGMVRDVPMYTIFRGVVPFFVAMVVTVVLIIIFPQITLLLPSMMIK